jgi:signal transduction histidine kinase
MRIDSRSLRVSLPVEPVWQILLVVGTFVLGLVVVWPWLQDDTAEPIASVCLATAYVAAGVLSAGRGETRPAGITNARLLVAIGLVALANEVNAWEWKPWGPWMAISWVTRPVDEMLLMVLLLRYPAARIPDQLSRRIVAVLLVAVLAPFWLSGLLWDPFADGWARTFWWPTVMAANGVAHHLWNAYAVAGLLAAVTVAVLSLRRYRHSRGLDRRELVPVVVSAGAVALAYVLLQIVAVVTLSESSSPVLNLTTKLVVLAVPVAFAAAELRRRLDRAAVADLVLEIDQPSTIAAVRDALRTALRDPTLEVYVWLPDRELYTDGSTTGTVPADSDRHRLEVHDSRGGRLALVTADPQLSRRADLVDAAVRAAALSLENARLHAELMTQLQELEESRTRIVEAGVVQRRRVERDLHDGAQQRLLTLASTIGRAHSAATDASLVTLLDQARAELRIALRDLRDLARGIHPAVLEQVGLAAAVETVAESMSLPVRVAVDPGRLAPTVEATVYFVICEGLSNAVKYAGATRAEVTVRRVDGALRVSVDDDGSGGARLASGGGLAGLRDRVAALGGTLVVDSPPGAGTHLLVDLPCAS